MQIDLSLVELFLDWLRTSFGSAVRVHEEPRGVELARGLLCGRFVSVRRAEEMLDATIVEVVCSDKEWLQDLEKSWVRFLIFVTKEGSKDAESE